MCCGVEQLENTLMDASMALALAVGKSYVEALPQVDPDFGRWVGATSPAQKQARQHPSRGENAASRSS